jgi:hypothetical protein
MLDPGALGGYASCPLRDIMSNASGERLEMMRRNENDASPPEARERAMMQ